MYFGGKIWNNSKKQSFYKIEFLNKKMDFWHSVYIHLYYFYEITSYEWN